MSLRPTLKTFRVVAYSSENRVQGNGEAWEIAFENAIEIGTAVPTVPGSPIIAIVKLVLEASAHSVEKPEVTAQFRGEYEGQFHWPAECVEADVNKWTADEEHQYLLAAQSFPLAMSHFRRELQSTGFDARNLPIGL